MLEIKVYQIRCAGLKRASLEARDPLVKDEDPTYDPQKDAEIILNYLTRHVPFKTYEALRGIIRES